MNASLQKYRNWEVNTEGAPAKLHFPHRIFKGWSRTGLSQGKTTMKQTLLPQRCKDFCLGSHLLTRLLCQRRSWGTNSVPKNGSSFSHDIVNAKSYNNVFFLMSLYFSLFISYLQSFVLWKQMKPTVTRITKKRENFTQRMISKPDAGKSQGSDAFKHRQHRQG